MNYNQLADAADRAAVQAQSWVEIRDAFRALGSIDGATKDAVARRDAATKEADKANAELDAAINKTADVKAKANTLLADADATAADRIAEGEAQAKRLIEDARASAAVMVSNGKEQAAALIAKTDADLLAEREEFTRVSAEVVALAEKRDALLVEADAAQKRYDSVLAAIAALKGA